MKLTTEERAKLRLTLGQMKNEIGVLQQSLEAAPPNLILDGYNRGHDGGFLMDEYLLKFRLGNVSDLAMHLLELLKLADKAA